MTEPKREFTPGATVAGIGSGRRFITMRTGQLCEDSSAPREGFLPFAWTPREGGEKIYYAKEYKDIIGYVNSIGWHKHTFPGGKSYAGWQIVIDGGAEGDFYFMVKTQDRPYRRLMSDLLNVDFSRMVKFRAYTDYYLGKKRQNLIMQQNPDDAKDVIQPQIPILWIGLDLQKKIKAGKGLTEEQKIEQGLNLTQEEARHLMFKDDEVTIDWAFPHIIQLPNDEWDFSALDKMLIEKMYEVVIPAVETACKARPGCAEKAGERIGETTPPAGAGDERDDDIPF